MKLISYVTFIPILLSHLIVTHHIDYLLVLVIIMIILKIVSGINES